jgi:putative acetyltransferase
VDGRRLAAGCLAFRPLTEKDCEFKRLYVRPAFRGQKLAQLLLERAICDARGIGYRHVYLDTFASLKSAIILYEKLGFQQISPYYENPLPDVLYYKLNL